MAYATQYTRNLVKKRVEAQMLAQITILRGDLGALDPSTGKVGGLTNTTVIYSGRARIWSVQGSGVLAIGQGTIDTRQTNISIPIDAPIPHRDDIVKVADDDLADADVDAHVFRVLDVDGGGYIGAARKLTCVSFFQSRYWGEQ